MSGSATWRANEHADARTVIRHVDQALLLLAAELLGPDDDAEQRGVASAGGVAALDELRHVLRHSSGYRTRELDVSVYLSRDRVDIRESRIVRALRHGIRHFVVSRILYWPDTTVETVATEGARIEQSLWPHSQYMVRLVRFAQSLAKGRSHHFVVTHTARGMAPLYTITPRNETEGLTIRLQRRDFWPETVWLIEHLPPDVLSTQALRPVLQRRRGPTR